MWSCESSRPWSSSLRTRARVSPPSARACGEAQRSAACARTLWRADVQRHSAVAAAAPLPRAWRLWSRSPRWRRPPRAFPFSAVPMGAFSGRARRGTPTERSAAQCRARPRTSTPCTARSFSRCSHAALTSMSTLLSRRAHVDVHAAPTPRTLSFGCRCDCPPRKGRLDRRARLHRQTAPLR